MSDSLRRDARPTFAELYTPKLVTVLREGYGLAGLRADVLAGLTVAIVALPLSMAIAIASGATPDRGLTAAIVGGFLVSALGGSRFQIGGPAGAFIVLVAATIGRHGVDGMLLATAMAGAILIVLALLRLGAYVRYVPYPVTVGFTAGIAVVILASQLRDLFGLTLAGPEPGELVPKLRALAGAAGTVNLAAVLVSAGTIAIIVAVRRFRPSWPGLLIAVVAASLVVLLFGLPVETIASRFGGIPSGLAAPVLPDFTLAKAQAVLPDAIAFALLGAIESLLSAVVADSMTGRRHRSNPELIAQGVANIGSALFGGMPVTGTIARTATNVRAGARGPVAGMLHAVFLLAFMLLAAPLAGYIPLAGLAGILAVVAWNMAERHGIVAIVRASPGDAVVLAATFLLTSFRDLTEGILAGFTLAALLFIHRMAGTARLARAGGKTAAAEATPPVASRPAAANIADRPIVARIEGAFFFGSAAGIGAALERLAGAGPGPLVIDLSAVSFVDSTAADAVAGVTRMAARRGVPVILAGVAPAVKRVLAAHGVVEPKVGFAAGSGDARENAAAASGEPDPAEQL